MAGGKLDKALQQLLGLAVEIKRVWENSSPGSAFANQTLMINLGKYDMVLVMANSGVGMSSRMLPPALAMVGGGGEIVSHVIANASVTSYRTFYARTTGVQFDHCESPSVAVPNYIYGIKLVGGGRSLIQKIKHLFADMGRGCFIWQH